MKMYLRLAFLIAITSALSGCPEGKRPFKIVQLCLGNQQNLEQFTNILKSIAQSEGMTFIDGNVHTERDLNAMGVKIDSSAPVIHLGIQRKDGMGLIAGNLDLPNYQVALGFGEGSNSLEAHRFAETVVRKMSERWRVVDVSSGRGALPLTTCGN
jgi:hypothetical protein